MDHVVKVPASSANLGPGYDVLGIALGVYNTYRVFPSKQGFKLDIKGQGENILPCDDSNLVIRCFNEVMNQHGKSSNDYQFEIENHIPLSRGMGSSASAIIGGISLAYQVLDLPFIVEEILNLAIPYEGHADNLIPALLGGLQLVYFNQDEIRFRKIKAHPDLAVVLVIPDGGISTEKARKVIPKNLSLEDCVFNMHRLALTIQCLQDGDFEELTASLKDRIHQPYRIKLLEGLEALFWELEKNFPGWVISGSGPTLLHFVKVQEQAKICQQIEEIIEHTELKARVLHCVPVSDGVLYMQTEEEV